MDIGRRPVRGPNFVELRERRRRVRALADRELASLSQFHTGGQISLDHSAIESFAVFLDEAARAHAQEHLSITSTATCIAALAECGAFDYGQAATYDQVIRALNLRLEMSKLTTSDLDDCNPFTIGLLLPVLAQMRLSASERVVQKCVDSAKRDLEKGPARIEKFPASGYLTYGLLRGLLAWEKTYTVPGDVVSWAQETVNAQIAVSHAGADLGFDPIQLAYALLIIEVSSGARPDALRDLALRTFFAAQHRRGLWEKRDPLFVYGKEGDAYCFGFELLSEMLRIFAGSETLHRYESNLKRAFGWIQRNKIQLPGKAPTWRSGHRANNPSPESWATAAVFTFLNRYEVHLGAMIRRTCFRRLRHEVPERADKFDRFCMPTVVLPDEHETVDLDKLLKSRLLDPLRQPDGTYSLVRSRRRRAHPRAGIFFGPPGTGKTELVSTIAAYLGWPLVRLDPGEFARGGLPYVARTTSELFDRLEELEDVVVFFDEMEELIRERSDHGVSTFEQRFLTTALLPMLQRLHDGERVIYIVATNHFQTLDRAAQREGRFDFHIQIEPPSWAAKRRHLKSTWPDAPAGIVERLAACARKVRWLTFAEWKALLESLRRDEGRAKEIVEAIAPNLLRRDSPQRREENKFYRGGSKFNRFPRGV